MKVVKEGSTGVFHHNAMVSPIIGFSHRGVDTHFCGDTAHEQVANPLRNQNHFQIGTVKRPLALSGETKKTNGTISP